jgi:hypothetical protein
MPGARDGQLRVRRGDDSPPWALQMFDDDLGLWLTLAQADVEEDAMRAGIPILRGPYVVDFSDIPHDGDTMTLWTPAVGDVLLRLFPDRFTVTQWDHGNLYIGQNVNGNGGGSPNSLVIGVTGNIALGSAADLDSISDAINGTMQDPLGTSYGTSGFVFRTTDPLQIQLAHTSGTDPTQGHVELYALVARAVTP